MSTAQHAGMTAEQAQAFMEGAQKQPARKRLAELVAGRDVIDIGCGKGEEVGELFTPEQYTGIDCSPALIEIARERWPDHAFCALTAQELATDTQLDRPRWPVGIMKAVLEHLPPDEALAVYEAARRVCDVLYVCWHWEPGEEKLTTYKAGGLRWQQNRHDRAKFRGMLNREPCGAHVIWTVECHR